MIVLKINRTINNLLEHSGKYPQNLPQKLLTIMMPAVFAVKYAVKKYVIYY